MDDSDVDETEKTKRSAAKAGRYGWPPTLVKALKDTNCYALQLTTGVVIQFSGAEQHDPSERWVRLLPAEGETDMLSPPSPPIRARGMDVRVESIVWVTETAT